MISFDDAALDRFLAEDPDGPVVMLNLLRYAPDGGRERYSRYLQAAGPLIARHGAELVYAGDTLPALAAEPGQSWDGAAIVRYPSRAAFAAMVRDPDYAAADHLRLDSVAEVTLQPMQTLGS